MTEAHEVHLFDWIRENLAWLGAFVTMLWAMVIFWYRTVIHKFYTKEVIEDRIDSKLLKCKMAVDDDTESILEEVRLLSRKVDHLDDRRREDAMANSAEHGAIRHDITLMGK